ncbi:MAG: DEAD/DEAH box helicase family protein [Anaerolineaceae bacterium]|jgi:type III restriction enzyme|nr:DEAD/DEAH box helicase family protein [Anaerolineaceae bacterium]
MKPKLELKFDHNLDFQLDAIQAVVDVFRGLPRFDTAFTLGDGTVPNLPEGESLSQTWLLENLLEVQGRSRIEPVAELAFDEGMVLEGAGTESWRYPSFTVEMETGTGKTYVYLRTIYELRKQYGFRKFIIVVPSIAIYEGVMKSFEVMKRHFSSLYSNETVNLIRYEGSKLSSLRSFATSSFVEVMVMTLQSFNTAKGRSSNTIYRPSEDLPGERMPFEYIQETRPILILDEPQNMSSDLSKEALRTLHPLFALRYSATHKEVHNLVYRLTPFDAYQRGLVKRIQVDGVFEQNNLDAGTLILRDVKTKPIRAVVQTLGSFLGKTQTVEVELKKGDDLYQKTHHPDHQHGYKVTEISAKKSNSFVDFDGHDPITSKDVFSASKQTIFRTQIERTIERHMRLQRDLEKKGIKVLSLFFIDRVANYVDDDGLIKLLFDEAFESAKQRYPWFRQWKADEVRNGYFARSKPSKGKEEGEAIDTDGSNNTEREAEREAFRLIMREKERLLSFDEPVSFVFAHSALKEGWDNPNVFQICTLNQTVSEMKKRQEIGRGLRLPVDQTGERIFDETINILTVVANESYEVYASMLQNEYREAGYDKLPPKVTRADNRTATRNQRVFDDENFKEFWRELTRKSKYEIKIDTSVLVEECVERFNKVDKRKLNPQVVIETGSFVITKFTIGLEDVRGRKALLRITVETSDGDTFPVEHSQPVERSDDLAGLLNEPRLRGYRVIEIAEDGDFSSVVFENDIRLVKGEENSFESESGQQPIRLVKDATGTKKPIFNLIDRAAKETGLTRKTINQIFKQVDLELKAFFIKNPEGFGNLFIDTLQEASADHMVKHLEFTCDYGSFMDYDLNEMFPPVKDFPQKELIEAGDAGMYDQVQIDSDVERRFVEGYLSGSDPKVIGYFKFPPAYKINLPKMIGNYNPDWGILRYNDEGRVVLKLVRETKGREDPSRLRFTNEQRKIEAATRHFAELGMDYRVVADTTYDWYEPVYMRSLREPELPFEEE